MIKEVGNDGRLVLYSFRGEEMFLREMDEPVIKLPYYGNQARCFSFFKEIIPRFISPGGFYVETNSGLNNNAFRFAKEFNYNVITNDLGYYSYSIARVVLDKDEDFLDHLDFAAKCASTIDAKGFNPKEVDLSKYDYYRNHLMELRNMGVRSFATYNLDLFDLLEKLYKDGLVVDGVFMDFAWPWRDGSKTVEYETTVDGLSTLFLGVERRFKAWDRTNVLENVIKAVKAAQRVSRWVFLSNQSSNYPDPETLEIELFDKGVPYVERYTMLKFADEVDNLGKERYFREYLYVIEGEMKREK